MKKEDYLKYYVQSSDHYLIPKYTFEELFSEMENWKEDAQKYKTLYNNMFECHCNRVQVETLLRQQKAFIKYLKEPINLIKQSGAVNITEYTSAKLDTLEEVLSKYKEIIGGKDE